MSFIREFWEYLKVRKKVLVITHIIFLIAIRWINNFKSGISYCTIYLHYFLMDNFLKKVVLKKVGFYLLRYKMKKQKKLLIFIMRDHFQTTKMMITKKQF